MCYCKLINAISTTHSTLLKVTNGLYAKELIPSETKDEMLVSAITPYERASKLVNAIEKQLEGSLDSHQYLLDVFHGLRNQGNRALTDLVNSKIIIGMYVAIICMHMQYAGIYLANMKFRIFFTTIAKCSTSTHVIILISYFLCTI